MIFNILFLSGDFSVRIWDIENSDNYLLKTEMINVGELEFCSLFSLTFLSSCFAKVR